MYIACNYIKTNMPYPGWTINSYTKCMTLPEGGSVLKCVEFNFFIVHCHIASRSDGGNCDIELIHFIGITTI